MEVQKVIIHELIKNQGETSARDFLTNAVLALNEETVNDRVYRIVLASERDRKIIKSLPSGAFHSPLPMMASFPWIKKRTNRYG